MHRVTPTSGPAGTGAGRRVTPGSPRGGAGRSHRVVSPACRPGQGSARTPAAAWCVSARTPAAAWLARHLLGLLVLALAACGAPADDAPSGDATEGRLATVTRVVDGDTIQVELDGDELVWTQRHPVPFQRPASVTYSVVVDEDAWGQNLTQTLHRRAPLKRIQFARDR